MSQAANTTTTSRRHLLVGLAAAPLAAAAPAAFAAGDPDARLVELGRQWQAAYERAETSSNEDFDAAYDARVAIEEQIFAIPAAGLTGLGVKMRIAAQNRSDWLSVAEHEVLKDVERLTTV
jgi:hypothetical protein